MALQQFGNTLVWVALAMGISSTAQADEGINPLEGITMPVEIIMTKEQIKKLCANTARDSDLILNYKELCIAPEIKTPEIKKKKIVPVPKKPRILAKKPIIQEPTKVPEKVVVPKPVKKVQEIQKQEVSVDKGETWMTLEQALRLGLLGAGALGVGIMLRNRRKTKNWESEEWEIEKKEVQKKPESVKKRQEPLFPSQAVPTDGPSTPDKSPSETMLLVQPWMGDLRGDTPFSSKPIEKNTPPPEADVVIPASLPVESKPLEEKPKHLTEILSQYQESLLKKQLEDIRTKHEETLHAMNEMYKELQIFIDRLPRSTNYSSVHFNTHFFFGRKVLLAAKKISRQEPYVYNFELTLHGAKCIYAIKKPFEDREKLQLFVTEKTQEEYDFRCAVAKEKLEKPQ